MPDLPNRTVTFLFTDIAGSTQLAQAYPDAMPDLLARHHALLRSAIESHNGHIFQIIGDAFCAAFDTAPDALSAALDAQRALHVEAWSPVSLHVRMGINTGVARAGALDAIAGGYSGYSTLARTQRVMSAAHPGQILLSNSSAELLRQELTQDIHLRDMGEHQLKGILNPEHLWQVVAPDLRQDFPPLGSLTATANNLPIQLTSFIGRETQLGDIKRLLQSARLLTLTGVGGTGKTRLALQVAAQVLDDFQDGVWLAQLAAISDPALVPEQVALALGIQVTGRAYVDLLKEFLRSRTLLLVLDNCEHLIDASGQLADTLLHVAPRLKILATSREALGISGESTYPVPSLACPVPLAAGGTRDSFQDISQFEAVRLFMDRARAVQPTFQLTGRNSLAVAQICARLDGIPLALELAAARVKGMTVEQIASRLDDRFRLLTGSSRTALPRQRTLQAAIDWSYNLLSVDERVLFCRLAVFAGGCTLEAVEFVCAGDGLPTSQILDLLLRLVDKSLVQADTQSIETRYHMLETIRQYAQEKFADPAQSDWIRDQHLEFFRKLAEESEAPLYDIEQPRWIERLETELDNIRAALRWAVDRSKIESGLRLAGRLHGFWTHANHVAEGRAWLSELMAGSDPTLSVETRATALSDIGWLAYWEHDFAGAQPYVEQSLVLRRQIGDKRAVADSLNSLGAILAELGDYKSARAVAEEALAIRRALGDRYHAGNTLVVLAYVNWQEGQIAQARAMFEESLAIKDELQRHTESQYPLLDYACMELTEGNLQQAQSLLTRGLRMLSGIIDKRFAAYYIECFAVLASAEQQWTRVAWLLGAAERWQTELHLPPISMVRKLSTQARAALKSNLDEAALQNAYAGGGTLLINQAIELALETKKPDPGPV